MRILGVEVGHPGKFGRPRDLELVDPLQPLPQFGYVLFGPGPHGLQHMAELQERLQRIDEFEVAWAAELAGEADFHAKDPRSPAGRT